MGLGCHCARKTHFIVQLGYEAALGQVGLPGCEMSQLGLGVGVKCFVVCTTSGRHVTEHSEAVGDVPSGRGEVETSEVVSEVRVDFYLENGGVNPPHTA